MNVQKKQSANVFVLLRIQEVCQMPTPLTQLLKAKEVRALHAHPYHHLGA
jgi:hypothetical protein